jgi:hypothetical protein
VTQITLGDCRPGPDVPDLEPGLTLLDTPHPKSTATHHVALDTMQRVDGKGYWVDAGNVCSTYALHDLAPHRRLLRRIKVARAFTGYQHHELVREVVNMVTPRTGALIIPNTAMCYRDPDVPDHEALPMLESALAALEQVCETYDIVALLTDPGRSDTYQELLADACEAEYESEQTAQGYRFEGEDFETTVYWSDGYWQTTIPYWVDLFGAVEAEEEENIGPITPEMMGA